MIQSAIWIAPGLCGCRLRITADFNPSDVDSDGFVYRKPKPYTIDSVDIVAVCDAHKHATESMIDTSGYFATPELSSHVKALADKYPHIQPALRQTRGYFYHPIQNPTSAECLAAFLFEFHGQKHSYPCGCSSYMHGHRDGERAYIAHPKHTKKCDYHADDTHDMKQAKIDHDEYMAMQALAEEP